MTWLSKRRLRERLTMLETEVTQLRQHHPHEGPGCQVCHRIKLWDWFAMHGAGVGMNYEPGPAYRVTINCPGDSPIFYGATPELAIESARRAHRGSYG